MKHFRTLWLIFSLLPAFGASAAAVQGLYDASVPVADQQQPARAQAMRAGLAQVLVRVTDRGPGIPAPVRERLFEPFVQGGQTLTDKSPGVGLGLSLARGLLRQSGADLAALPTAAGAAFEIRLPRASAP